MAQIGMTNRGRLNILKMAFRNESAPGSYFLALVTNASVPDADTDTMADLVEIDAGNGYTSGGIPITRDSTGFDQTSEDDTEDKSSVTMKDSNFPASGGTVPASGDPASYFVLTGDGSPVSIREIYAFGDLEGEVTVLDGSQLSVNGFQLSIKKPS